MIRVGIIGMGSMGFTHLNAFAQVDGARVVAVADPIRERREGRQAAGGNIQGQGQGGVDFSAFRQYDDGMKLIADPDLDLIDICLITPLHAEFTIAALRSGRHVLVEKPFARTSAEAAKVLKVARTSPGLLMCAMCMRFWPGWDWLKERIEDGTYGRVYAAHFRRVTAHPGRAFYADGDACGGALLDLHIHDADFVAYCFGPPRAVFSRGYTKVSGQPDHVVTQYLYGEDTPLVVAEGGWAMASGFGFQMQYTVNFEKATAIFDLNADPQLNVAQDGRTTAVSLPSGMGYEHEIRYFLECIRRGTPPRKNDPADAAFAVRLIEAELKSIRSGRIVPVPRRASPR